MTDELTRLANGVLWPGFLGTQAPSWLTEELQNGLAGVVYFAQNMGPDVAALSAELRAANPRVLIGVDEEGGSVTRLEAGSGSTLPGAAQLGVLNDLAATRATGAELARRVAAAGANVVLAPVADVNTDPRNPVIGVRAFGSDTEEVSAHVVASVEGIQGGGIAACVKHFPGHGDTHLDSHHALPSIDLTPAEIERDHLPPFRAAIAAGVDSIMTAHIVVPAWGEQPATLNADVLGMLRRDGFEGVIITDALDMAAIRESVGIGGGAAQALIAGVDLICIGNPTNPGPAMLPDQDERDFHAARDGILAALRDGSLSRERLEEAVARVARLGEKLAAAEVAQSEVLDAAEIVARALSVQGALPAASASALSVIDARTRSTLAVDSAAAYVGETLAEGGFRVRVDTTEVSPEETSAAIAEAVRVASERDLQVIALVDRLHSSAAQRDLVAQVALAASDAVVVNVGLASAQTELPLPLLDVRAASRIGAAVARERLIGAS
ncbi:beta-N-acetylhexosaminidase [Microbacterium keratanolyticum]|uniref:Hydrolase n=1 Tax=Microbacterium keratanolyticum TaxID=67574 RepID=A0A9W6M7R0_9MICO|nr:glycoside hydrolase family 3 N-terminal domain-containing protein [Microbacterium keratanolyticum]MBM7468234.1 beta-N-acetylhexosaminidase [Microbacterium keratanolyticum]GLK00309.1 hydrolase [Microbacterium keratanolyticum]